MLSEQTDRAGSECHETGRVKASTLPRRKLKARQSAWQGPQLCADNTPGCVALAANSTSAYTVEVEERPGNRQVAAVSSSKTSIVSDRQGKDVIYASGKFRQFRVR